MRSDRLSANPYAPLGKWTKIANGNHFQTKKNYSHFPLLNSFMQSLLLLWWAGEYSLHSFGQNSNPPTMKMHLKTTSKLKLTIFSRVSHFFKGFFDTSSNKQNLYSWIFLIQKSPNVLVSSSLFFMHFLFVKNKKRCSARFLCKYTQSSILICYSMILCISIAAKF